MKILNLIVLIFTEGQRQEPKGAFDIATCKYSYKANPKARATKHSMVSLSVFPLHVLESYRFDISTV